MSPRPAESGRGAGHEEADMMGEYEDVLGAAVAAAAAAAGARFWPMTRALLGLRHHDLASVQHAARRADVDFDRLLSLVRGGVGADRVADDVASARASSVGDAPAIFVNGERF